MSRTAVVLFNLGGPDRLEAVRPFLFNLFNDPAIIGVPAPIRWLLAQFISFRRAPLARAIYQKLGGGSPLLANTRAQARALEVALAERGRLEGEIRVFIVMRYWHPRSPEAAAKVQAYAPDRVVLLPLYPQFSTTTSGSSIVDWQRAAVHRGLTAPSTILCCYPAQAGFVAAVAAAIRPILAEAAGRGRPRVLFSAHGLPKRIVERGDPYQWQVERSVAAVVEALGEPELDWRVCYQSKVGPLEWLGPATEDEIRRAGTDRVPLVVVPIAFVSEHSETLVELDLEYRQLAEACGVAGYHRVATVGTAGAFIAGLAALVEQAVAAESSIRGGAADGGRLCPARCVCCPQAGAGPSGAT